MYFASSLQVVVVNAFLDNTAPVLEHRQRSARGAGRHVQEDDDHVPEHRQVLCVRPQEIHDGRILHRPQVIH